jgi:transposase
MIQVTPHMRVLVAIEPQDFRKGIDGFARVCKSELSHDPFSGCVFVFGNRKRTAIKVLVYDGQGFWLCQKRLSRGRFPFWPQSNDVAKSLEAHELQVLFSAGNPAKATGMEPWKKVSNL